MNTRILEIQTALKKAGYDPGPLDGIKGRRTIAAIKAFQRDTGLAVDGVAGVNTMAALASYGDQQTFEVERPPWIEEAYRLLGTKEVQGQGSNPVILDWAPQIGIDYESDDIPWCGLFVAHCIASQLADERLPTNPLGARAWLTFGDHIEPTPGAVLVFWRRSRNNWRGHVGFCAGWDSTHYLVLGGNQGDAVSIMRIPKARLLDSRWPSTVSPVNLDLDGLTVDERYPVSSDEQ